MPTFISSIISLVALNLPFSEQVSEQSGLNTEHLMVITNVLIIVATVALTYATMKMFHATLKDLQKAQAEENAEIQQTTRLMLRVVRALGLANTEAKHRLDS